MSIRMYAGLGILAMLFLVSLSEAKGCYYNGKYYKIGSSWVQGSNMVCVCTPNGKPHCHYRLGKCNAWGDPHFTSFDGKKFDFQGVCRYVLSRDCCNNSFSIEVEHRPYSPTTAVTDKFTIRFGSRFVHLEKVQVLSVDGPIYPGLFFDDAQLRCEMVAGFMMVTLKNLGIWFRWNWHYHVQVFADRKYQGQLCGLCADFNGDPNNDLSLTPTGEPVTTISEWGESWRTKKQPQRCNGSDDGGNNGHDDCKNNPQYVALMSQCRSVMMGPWFSACRRRINPANFIADCETEMCECAKMNKKGCICAAVNGYEQACEDAGIAISDAWKLKYGCGVCKDPVTGTIYEHGQSWRHKCHIFTCTNGAVTSVMLKGCCYDNRQYYLHGQTWHVGCEIRTCHKGEIIKSLIKNCCYHNRRYYLPGHTFSVRCKTCVCRAGKWDCKINKACCLFRGVSYTPGQSWKFGCYACYCRGNGRYYCRTHYVLCRVGWKRVSPCKCVPNIVIAKKINIPNLGKAKILTGV